MLAEEQPATLRKYTSSTYEEAMLKRKTNQQRWVSFIKSTPYVQSFIMWIQQLFYKKTSTSVSELSIQQKRKWVTITNNIMTWNVTFCKVKTYIKETWTSFDKVCNCCIMPFRDPQCLLSLGLNVLLLESKSMAGSCPVKLWFSAVSTVC